eukprot:TRINITY_DN66207_c0_g1_i1.p1 TRINITY_DN66207_c0_g1~~TRINITY_DN66207_c0_g1_i1.p1  ORF type:complete len:396 (+),score=82.52 TRINITY_DN66207_c0_g1_i1:44-1231(+)
MKRRGVCIGGAAKVRKWRSEEVESDDAKSLNSDASLGEQLPSEEEQDGELVAKDAVEASCVGEDKIDPNPIVWLKVRIGAKSLSSMYIELFRDIHPSAADVFCALCRSDFDLDGRHLGYAGTEFHRITKGFVAQAGDIEAKLSGLTLGARRPLIDEIGSAAVLSHSRVGLLSVAARGRDADGMQFFITLGSSSAARQQLDAMHIVIGQVLGGGGGEEKALHPLRHLEANGSASGTPLEQVVIEACGVCDDAERQTMNLAPLSSHTSEKERYERSEFMYQSLRDVVTEANAQEVLDMLEPDMQYFERRVADVETEAEPSMEVGTSSQVFRQCEQLEVGMTRLLLILDEIDYRTLGSVRDAGKRAKSRIRLLGGRLSRAKACCQEGETEAYEQRDGM